MTSLLIDAFLRFLPYQDSWEEVLVGTSYGVVNISVDPAGLIEDGVHIENVERPKQKGGLASRIFKSPQEPAVEYATGFRAASSQWRGGDESPWCMLEGYDFLHPARSKGSTAARFIGYIKKEIDDLTRGSKPHWARTTKKLRLEDGPHGQLRVIILCETYAAIAKFGKAEENLASPLASAHRFMAEVQRLETMYRPLRMEHNLKQIYMLQLHHAHLNLFADFLETFADDYAVPRMRSFDPSQAELRRWNLKVIMTDSQLYRRLTSAGTEMTTTAESLLDVVSALSARNDIALAALSATIRGCSKDITTRSQRMSEDLKHHLELLSLARDMSQSGNVQVLTLLATIFLPLSLSAGVLSMQSRFKDLGDLLYDFIGVVVLLGAVVVLILVGIAAFSAASELESRLWRYRAYKKYMRPILFFMIASIGIILGALVLTSFLVGMLKDVVLGAKILGYGVLVAVGAPVLISLLILLAVWIDDLRTQIVDSLPSLHVGKQKANLEDPEGGLSREPKGKETTRDGIVDAGIQVQAGDSHENGQDPSGTQVTEAG